ncbi:MAG TPA: DoxX family protein [Chloroflexota bacterium]
MAISYAVRPAALMIAPAPGAASRKLSATLWTLQSLLAVIFLFSGAMKLLAPAEMMEAQSPLPLFLVRFIGTCEVAGALGMLLPGLLRIRPSLTPLAATGLLVLMIGATVLTPIMISPDPVMTLIPATVGAMAAFVAYARLQLAPLRGRRG